MLILRPGQTELAILSPAVALSRPHGLSAMYNSLISYWKLDEVSGSRADSIGSNTLTDNNTVTSNTGIVYPLAAETLIANSENLSLTDNASISTGDINFWLAAWVRPGAITNSGIVAKALNDAVAGYEYALYLYATGEIGFVTGNASAISTVKTGASSVAANSYYLAVGYHNSATTKLGISLNGAAPTEVTRNQAPIDSTKNFSIGSVGAGAYLTGRIGPVMFGKNYIPTAGNIAALYNAGLGMTLEAMKDY